MEFDISFGLRAHEYSEEEIAQIVKIMREKTALTQGRYLAKFEEKFRRFASVESVRREQCDVGSGDRSQALPVGCRR